MKFTALDPGGVWLIELEPVADERGFFARSWDTDEFAARGLDSTLVQMSVSFNRRQGTLRGLHYQSGPYEEAKVVRCSAGSIFDVAVDIRNDSATRGSWSAVELSAENRCALYIPPGFAHGFQTLVDGAEVIYQISTRYSLEKSRGVRWDDPELAISWPVRDPILSPRDRDLPLLSGARGASGRVD